MRSLLYVAIAALFLFMACKKDEATTDCMKLEGKWTALSWLEDDEQFFGDTIFITSSVIEFMKLDGVQGDVDWMITYTVNGSEDLFGSYVVNASCDEVTITPKSGAPTTYAFTINGNKLTLDTHDNHVHVVQEYRRE